MLFCETFVLIMYVGLYELSHNEKSILTIDDVPQNFGEHRSNSLPQFCK